MNNIEAFNNLMDPSHLLLIERSATLGAKGAYYLKEEMEDLGTPVLYSKVRVEYKLSVSGRQTQCLPPRSAGIFPD